jgi:hypothetical protein
MPRGNYRHFLRLLLRGDPEALVVEVRESEADRLRSIIDRFAGESSTCAFFWFDTVDGKSYAVNLGAVQAVHFLWDGTPLPVDLTRYEGPIVISLRDRRERIEAHTDSPEELFGFFSELEQGAEVVPFPSFPDEDGERLFVSASEVVYAMAPVHVIDEGKQKVNEELGDPDAGAEDL